MDNGMAISAHWPRIPDAAHEQPPKYPTILAYIMRQSIGALSPEPGAGIRSRRSLATSRGILIDIRRATRAGPLR